MNTTKRTTPTSRNDDVVVFFQDNAKSKPKKTKQKNENVDLEKIFQVCNDDIFSTRHSNYYEVTVLNHSTIEVQCYLNYHRLSGNHYRHCLPDGQWTGNELICEVDYYKERYRLSLFIIFVTAALALTFLGVDFSRHLKKRLGHRSQKRRLAMCRLKKTFQHDIIKGSPLYKASKEHYLHLLPTIAEDYDLRKLSSSTLASKESYMGAFGYRSGKHPVPKRESSLSVSKVKRFEKGMFLFRMKTQAFSHPDDPQSGST